MTGFNLRIPPPGRRARSAVPGWLEKIIMRCLSGNPGERFQSVDELRDELLRRGRSPSKARRIHVPNSVIEIMILFAIISLLAAILVPNWLRARPQGSLTACQSNLKNMGTALEMYSTDARGRYPLRLEDITPNYLKVIPTCPVNGRNSYVYTRRENPDVYTTYCRTKNRKTTEPSHMTTNFPQYDSIQGLVEQ